MYEHVELGIGQTDILVKKNEVSYIDHFRNWEVIAIPHCQVCVNME